MNIIKYKKIFLGFSIILILGSLGVIIGRGLDYGLDFTGGTVLEVSYQEKPSIETVRADLNTTGIETSVQPFGENGYVIKTKSINDDQRKQLIAAANISSVAEVERFNSIGPSIGKELKTKSLYALIFVSLGIVLFITYAFRAVSGSVASWKYGVAVVIALLHDILIPVGILTLLGTEIDTLYVVGLLSILGLSVNDTIVVFDRIREELSGYKDVKQKPDFDEIIGGAISKTMSRSIFTSLTLVVVLITLYFIGPVATQTLALVLLLGTIVGTYSSICVASPLLTYMVSDITKQDEK
jgi:preprotein translocase subunit SecF